MRRLPARPALRVPFLDLRPSHAHIKEDLLSSISTLIDRNAFINGPDVGLFEEAYAAYCGTAEAIGVASGLDALRLSLLAVGVQPEDEVIVPAFTFAATVEAVVQAGARPVLVDVSDDDYALAPLLVESALSARTCAIVPVHLYGQMADMRGLGEIADAAGVVIVEDACQAHGAEREGQRAGAAGVTGCFSFYPGKNLGAMGDAGAVTTSDPDVAGRIRALREHGQTTRYVHELVGYTSRLDTLQALVLRHKLPLLDGWNEERQAAVAAYVERLDGVGDIGLPPVALESQPAWHLFVVTTADPQGLAEFLGQREIGTGRHYPEPIHLAGAYRDLGYEPGAFPVAERLARTVLSLPLFPGISEEQVEYVASAVADFFNRV
jgi:dTDP-4-amino-4,6-dideoxygalactose transaminase